MTKARTLRQQIESSSSQHSKSCNIIPAGKNNHIRTGNPAPSEPVMLASVENEIEARFLVPKSSLLSGIRHDKIIRINQFYISEDKRAQAIKKLLEMQPKVASLLILDIKTFRLREQHSRLSGKTAYFAQLKSKRKSLSRKEVSVTLSQKQFRELLKFADEGYVSKNRIIKSGFISRSGKKVKIEAHIDQILALGLGKNRIEGQALPGFLERYAIVEIELPDESCYQVLKRESWGSFNFIETGFNLQDIRERLGSKISFKSLSRGKSSRGKLQKIVESIEKSFPAKSGA